MKKYDAIDMFGVFFIGIVVSAILCAFASYLNPMHTWAKLEAVKQGHAEFYLDDHYEKQWRWLPTTK